MWAGVCLTGERRLEAISETCQTAIDRLAGVMGERLSLAVSLALGGNDQEWLEGAMVLSRRVGVALLATNHVHYHEGVRRPVQDVLTCVRHGCTLQEAGYRLFANGERYLKPPEKMWRLFEGCPAAIERGLEIVRNCRFSLAELRYEYPTEAVPKGLSPSVYLRQMTYEGAEVRYPNGIPKKVEALIEKELAFICGSKYESYFLTVYDLVREARGRGILCQGRGSAANSAVCYCLGVTSVDPAHFQLVFERFASESRGEPPDIDVDFEHERREEIIQYVYDKYGREYAGMTASLITYRGRSAVRDVGKAMGLSGDLLDALSSKLDWWHKGSLSEEHLKEAGVDPADATIRRLIDLTTQVLGFPRHLSQHVGGMVISRRRLCELVPIENASMDGRTVIEWDKDDLDVIGLFKVDILALGMLTAISRALVLVKKYDRAMELYTIPAEDSAVYDMVCEADTVGVFQIESRAQMSMLPRLRPRKFYDLVIEVAIVRPGPIQGKMVHPYLQRRERQREDPDFEVPYPSEELREVLKETLGVPLFQEQAMRVAVVAAGFTPSEADALRRAMAAWKRRGGLAPFRDKFIGGMLERGYEPEFAEQCFSQISGFGEYGFPESHAASFANLVYASCWLKRHHPAAFLAALLNSQPMGFYAPAQLVRDAREHGVEVRAVDVNISEWDCSLEFDTGRMAAGDGDRQQWGKGGPAVRLGLCMVKGLRREDGQRLVEERLQYGRFESVAAVQRWVKLEKAVVDRLAGADAFASMGLTRRGASWESLALDDEVMPMLAGTGELDMAVVRQLPAMSMAEEVFADYETAGLSLKRHPVSFARNALTKLGAVPAATLRDEGQYADGRRLSVAGLVLVRQRPGTASGVVFITLEDETGTANLIVWSAVYERYRQVARHASLLQVTGVVQRHGKVVHILAHRLYDRSELISPVVQRSRDFH
jgi:error-prone DNA polymerase